MDEFADPTGTLEVEKHPLAPRLADLKGTRLGAFENQKTNAAKFLTMVFEEMRQRYGVAEFKLITKAVSQPAPIEYVQDLAKNTDFAITGIGD